MFKAITLEVSLKPFKQTSEGYIRSVCKGIFRQWNPLLKNRQEISIMLWVGDGSELLDYDGDLDKSFEWAYFIGTANLPLLGENEDVATSLHNKKRKYIENPPKMTYKILKNIIRIFKEEGTLAFPTAKIRVGETFDIGPEFAVSDFKYNRHSEICTQTTNRLKFVDSTSLLNADTRPYAAYPNGIPQNLPFATFLGAQTQAFFQDMGFDYIWLSNGLGFSADPWALTGKIFDGTNFYTEKLGRTSKKVFQFWKLFREACKNVPIETRGTNNSAGIDYATDGVPLWDIYNAGFQIMPPPNSPWAALNDNYGLEIMGHMTRICNLPDKDFLFRYYIHDPWWMNSPWYDRYDGFASDIYLPMSVTRIDENGKPQTATRFNILSIDNSKGDMPDACVYEPLPHILKAEKDSADELPFLLWLYPMKEYTTSQSERDLHAMYFGDKFVMESINQGLPLNTVISTDVFKKVSTTVYENRIILSPIIYDEETVKLLSDFAKKGGKLLLYGEEEGLSSYSVDGKNVIKVAINRSPSLLRESLAKYGYQISFETQEGFIKLPAMTINRCNNGLFFSIYNPDTTTDTLLRFPLGAPILMGGETQIKDGTTRYRFSRCEHRECRIFVQQKDGIISAHEEPPVSEKYRRRIAIRGLKDAIVYYFPEQYCNRFVAVTDKRPDATPQLDEDWTPIYDEVMGFGFKGEQKNGNLSFLMPFEKYL